MNNKERFQRLYNGDKSLSYKACDSVDIGSSYRCPIPTIGGPITNNNIHHPRTNNECDLPEYNMGKLVHCPSSAQKGGGGDKKPSDTMHDMIYNATGQFVKTKAYMAKLTPEKDTHLQYGHDLQESPGYFLDLSAPRIGNRAVHKTRSYNKTDAQTANKKVNNAVNYPGRGFDCSTPKWDKSCI